MSRPKKPDAKIHITATISQQNNNAVKEYQNDEKNRDKNGDRPTLSSLIDQSLSENPRLKPYH
jgi:hypothetical protein